MLFYLNKVNDFLIGFKSYNKDVKANKEFTIFNLVASKPT